MRQSLTIAGNTFMELVRQPIFLLLMTASGSFCVFLAAVPYFGFGDDPKMVKDSVLAIMLLTGLVGAVLSASASLAREIQTGTALAVLSKPVSRTQFLLAKYAGLAAALTILVLFNTVAALLASRMAFDAYGNADTQSLGLYFGMLALAYLVGGFTNYFLDRVFVTDTVVAACVLTTAAFLYVAFFTEVEKHFGEAQVVDWRLLPAAALILGAVWVLAGLALACSTRLEMLPTLAICTAVFVLGLMSDYLFGTRAEEQGQWWAVALYAAFPNWQLFWMSDALGMDKAIPWGYVARTLAYSASYVGAVLAVALVLFQDRELS